MKFEVEETPVPGCLFIRAPFIGDHRGGFGEVYRADEFSAAGIPLPESHQVNHSKSIKGVLRGLHFQWNPPMAKLMRVIHGEAYLVAVDIRKDSPTLGKHFGRIMKGDPADFSLPTEMLWAPASFARGFAVLSDTAVIEYICTGSYTTTKEESGILWNDPAIGIEWPIADPILSDKDRTAQTLSEWLARPESDNFRFGS
jgi:dTDP-4-dehydrorhamnose 3,5-epimerase